MLMCVSASACLHTCVHVCPYPKSQLSQAERELMWGWHFAGICGALNHFYVWDLGFWYLHPSSLWALGQVFRLWDPICVQLLLASTGPEVFEASCCHDPDFLSSASSRAMARYAADSGITIKKREWEGERRTERERGRGGKGGGGVMGWRWTSCLFMLGHMSRIC